jgi:iron complex transport system substrate-binding protein
VKRLLAGLALLASTSPALAFPIDVDSCGETVTFDAAPETLVVHDINMAEMAFALDLQDRIVGLTGITGWYKTTEAFDARRGDIPELAPKYPSLETLVAADPDVFLAGWYYGMKPGGDVTPDTLAALGIKTLVLSESCIHLGGDRPAATMDLLFDDVLRLGRVFDREDRAIALIDGWKAQLADIRETVGDMAGTRVFLYDSGDDKPFTAGKHAVVNAMIEAAGGVNVMADMDSSWSRTSWEVVAASNPEFLILLDYQDGGGADSLLAFLREHPAMKDTDAVKNGRFVPLRYEELTPGPANIDAIRKIAGAMYSELSF